VPEASVINVPHSQPGLDPMQLYPHRFIVVPYVTLCVIFSCRCFVIPFLLACEIKIKCAVKKRVESFFSVWRSRFAKT
jgi:hypothetical protein